MAILFGENLTANTLHALPLPSDFIRKRSILIDRTAGASIFPWSFHSLHGFPQLLLFRA